MSSDERAAGPGPRREVEDAGSTSRDVPHVTENAEGAPVQASTPAKDDVSILPANAQGKDVVEAQNEVEEVDEGSMYDRRPGEDKDRGKTEMP